MSDDKTGREKQRAAQAGNERLGETESDGLHPGNWPVDAQGDPMVEVSFEAGELVGLREFSNIVVGPARVRTLVSRNTPNPFTEKQLANVASALNQLAQVTEVDVIAEQRDIALATIDPRKRYDVE